MMPAAILSIGQPAKKSLGSSMKLAAGGWEATGIINSQASEILRKPTVLGTPAPGNACSGPSDSRWSSPLFSPDQSGLFFPHFAESGRFGQRKDHHLFAGRGANVVVQAQDLDTSDFLDHSLHDRPRGFDQMGPHLLE